MERLLVFYNRKKCFLEESTRRIVIPVSENIGLFSSALLPNREKETLQQFLNQVFLFYKKYGFSIDCLDVDLEFKCVKDDLQPNVNLYDKNSHVHPAERAIRTVKE